MKMVSEAELKVLKIIFEEKCVTSREIIERLYNEKWSDNTIRTLIKRLINKEIIRIDKKIGRNYYYKANVSKSKFYYERTKLFLKQFYDGDIEKLYNFYKEY